MALLDGLANFKGPMSAEAKARVRAAIENPTSETWERAYSLVLRPDGTMLWNAVCAVDPTFPTIGPGSDERGRRRPWARVPDQLTIVRALRAAASGRPMSRPPEPVKLEDVFRGSTQREERYQAEQAWRVRWRFWLPVVLFWVGFVAVKVLPRLHRVDTLLFLR